MTTLTRKRTTIELNPGDKESLQNLARHLGYIQKGGIEKGQGSLSALMQAIARGEIEITKSNHPPAPSGKKGNE
jgi:hypothetical protein